VIANDAVTPNLIYRLNVQVTAYSRQTIPDRGVVRSCYPLKIWELQSYHRNGWT